MSQINNVTFIKKMYLWYRYDLKGMMTTMVFVDNTVTINIILDE